MITETEREEVFIQASESSSLKLVAAISALVITALVFVGYAYLRKRHLQDAAFKPATVAEPRLPPQALIEVDEAMLQGRNTLLGGTVRNVSNERLSNLSVELELKRRQDGTAERKMVPLSPAELQPSQEGRYSLQLKAQDYIAAKVVGLHSGSEVATLRFTVAPGAKRPPERLETKTITVGKRPGQGSEFLNSPDNPARVP